MNTLRRSRLSLAVGLLIGLVSVLPAAAQTALNSTTTSAAVTSSAQVVPLSSVSNIAAGDMIIVDREFMQVQAVNSASVNVTRGLQGTKQVAHVSGALVYSGPQRRFYSNVPAPGACTSTNEQYLPRILKDSGEVWDCPVGTGVWTLLNGQQLMTAKSVWFNLDNGAGTTVDDVLIRNPRPIRIAACRIVYVDATAGTVAGGNAKVGITVGGAEVVAATAYTNGATVGSTTAMTVVDGTVAGGTAVFVRHTGVAATQAGQAFVECDYTVR